MIGSSQEVKFCRSMLLLDIAFTYNGICVTKLIPKTSQIKVRGRIFNSSEIICDWSGLIHCLVALFPRAQMLVLALV